MTKEIIDKMHGVTLVEKILSDGSSVFSIEIERTILHMSSMDEAHNTFNEITFQFSQSFDIDNKTERKLL